MWRGWQVTCAGLRGTGVLPACSPYGPHALGSYRCTCCPARAWASGEQPPSAALAFAGRHHCFNCYVCRSSLGAPAWLAWLAAATPQCPNIEAFHLVGTHFDVLPVLPCVVHLLLEMMKVTLMLLASVQNLPLLEPLLLSGDWHGLGRRNPQLRWYKGWGLCQAF